MLSNIKRLIKDKDLQGHIHLIIGDENVLGIPIEWNNLIMLNITDWNTGSVVIDDKTILVILSPSIAKDKIIVIDSKGTKYTILNVEHDRMKLNIASIKTSIEV